MGGESKNSDLKTSFDLNSEEAKIDLIKNLVAFANAGGGSITFGRDETNIYGIDDVTIQALDSARVNDMLSKFISPAQLDVSHEIEKTEGNKLLFTLIVPRSEIPLVMARQGTWKGFDSKKDKPVFAKGDIWTRHGTKTERVTYEDIRECILSHRTDEKESVLDRITTLVNLPDGASIEVIDHAGAPIDTPKGLLASSVRWRDRDHDHLLSPKDLLWIFQNRFQITFHEAEIALLVASALRKGATLYYWLAEAEQYDGMLESEIMATFDASDRDKSDAARNIVEISSIYLGSQALRKVLRSLRQSKYTHFREEAADWVDREQMKKAIAQRVMRSRFRGKRLVEFPTHDLEAFASELSVGLITSRSTSDSRNLSSITRVLWSRKSSSAGFAQSTTV